MTSIKVLLATLSYVDNLDLPVTWQIKCPIIECWTKCYFFRHTNNQGKSSVIKCPKFAVVNIVLTTKAIHNAIYWQYNKLSFQGNLKMVHFLVNMWSYQSVLFFLFIKIVACFYYCDFWAYISLLNFKIVKSTTLSHCIMFDSKERQNAIFTFSYFLFHTKNKCLCISLESRRYNSVH